MSIFRIVLVARPQMSVISSQSQRIKLTFPLPQFLILLINSDSSAVEHEDEEVEKDEEDEAEGAEDNDDLFFPRSSYFQTARPGRRDRQNSREAKEA